MQSENRINFLPKTKKELANEYGMSPGTIANWCKKIGIETCSTLTIPEVKRFYAAYDYPERDVSITKVKQKKLAEL